MNRFDDILEDVARKAILDPKTISDIMECDPIEFANRVATMITPPKYEVGMSVAAESFLLRSEFEGWLIEQAKELFYIKQTAQADLNNESFYGAVEGLPCGWREQREAA